MQSQASHALWNNTDAKSKSRTSHTYDMSHTNAPQDIATALLWNTGIALKVSNNLILVLAKNNYYVYQLWLILKNVYLLLYEYYLLN